MKYDELQPVILLNDILTAIRVDDIEKLRILLEILENELPIWRKEINF
jgi:hypothetical protein